MVKSESSPSESQKSEALKSLLAESLLAKSWLVKFFLLRSYLLKSGLLKSGLLKPRALQSRWLKSRFSTRSTYAGVWALCLLAVFLGLPSWAAAQSFTLLAGPLSEDAVAPGGTSSAQVTVGTLNGFSSTVDLSCQVTPAQPQTTTDTPTCTVSPATVTPPVSASATITTMGGTSTVRYSITVTGTAASNAQTTITSPLYMTVLDVTPQFTITVQKAAVPSSVPAGNSGVAVVDINPIYGYSTAPNTGVTLSCSSITPLVVIPPICTFDPNPVPVSGTGASSSTLTISTYGPVVTTTGAVVRPRSFYARSFERFYAIWLPLPMLALVGLGTAAVGKRARKAWGLLALFVLSGTFILMPACGSNTATSTATPNGVTPNGTYSFTISGVDNTGVVSSNAGSGSTNPTVSLTVTTATQ
jgi:hypothetical protein